ncbi:MAG: hypothetical protein IPP13_28325 [Kouleothrix sp.]|nr:hypothetical protein [Kouleothrix sp.]
MLGLLPTVRLLGPPVADQPTRLDPVPLLDATFLIYPDGLVTLRVPIAVEDGAAQLTVQVTDMACSTQGYCMPPVEQKAVVLELAQPG